MFIIQNIWNTIFEQILSSNILSICIATWYHCFYFIHVFIRKIWSRKINISFGKNNIRNAQTQTQMLTYARHQIVYTCVYIIAVLVASLFERPKQRIKQKWKEKDRKKATPTFYRKTINNSSEQYVGLFLSFKT